MSTIKVKSANCPSDYTFKTCRARKYAGKCIKETKKTKPVKKTQKKKKVVKKKKATKKTQKRKKKAKKPAKKKAPSLSEMFGIKKKKPVKKTKKKKKKVVKKKKPVKKTKKKKVVKKKKQVKKTKKKKKKKATKKTLKRIKMKCNLVKRKECLLVKKICNTSTGRCKNPEKPKTVKRKTVKPKTVKRKTIKPKTVKRKAVKTKAVKKKTVKNICPAEKVKKCESDNKVCNTVTGRCIKKPKPILKKHKPPITKSRKLKTKIRLVNFENDALIKNLTEQVSKHPTTKKPKTKKPTTKKPTVRLTTKKPTIIKSMTPLEIESLGTDIQKSLSKVSKTPSMKRLASYSPSVNKQLVTKKSIDRQFIGGCYDSREATPKIKVGEKCIKSTSVEGQKVLLDNLASKRLISFDKIHAPKQNESNCWFNTMFMCFFISDKGRKFFKFFRQLMIKGIQLNNKKVKKSLHNAFLHLDMYIDAVLSGESYQWPQEIDTNNIIKRIYNAMPKKYRTNKMIRDVGEAHNPLKEYNGILNYLGNNTVPFKKYEVGHGMDVNDLQEITEMSEVDSNVEILMVEIYNDDNGPGDSGKGGPEWERKEVLELDDGRKFALDSAIVRDTENRHFCCVMNYDKKECGFDGVSFRRLSPFSWKDYLNKNEEWTFEGSNWSDGSGNIKWNFKNGYQILFYYKV